MVEENFKINIDLQLDQTGFADLQKQIERAVKDAFTKATKGIKIKAPGAEAAPLNTATSRSAREAISVSGDDLGNDIRKAISEELRGFSKATERVEKAVNRLTSSLERGVVSGGGFNEDRPSINRSSGNIQRRLAQNEEVIRSRATRVSNIQRRKPTEKNQEALETERGKLLQALRREQRLKAAGRQTADEVERSQREVVKANQELAKARKAEASASRKAASESRSSETIPVTPRSARNPASAPKSGPREQLALKQEGAPNQQTGANIDATRRGGSERTAGGAGTNVVVDSPRVRDDRVGSVQDRPNFKKTAEKRVEAREQGASGTKQEAAAERVLSSVSSSVDQLESRVREISQFKNVDIRKLLNLPTKDTLSVGRGAAPVMGLPSGQEKVVKQTLDVTIDDLGEIKVEVGNIVTKRIDDLLKGDSLSGIEKVSRSRPDRAEAMLRQEINKINELPKHEPTKVMGSMGTAGQAEMTFRPNAEQRERIARKAPGAERIAETSVILQEMVKGSKAFEKAGLEVVSVLGLAEDKAADLAKAIDAFVEGDTESIQGLVQTRNIADLGVGGSGSMRQARSFLMTQAEEMVGGEEPKIKGLGEEAAFAGDVFGKKAVKHLKTAVVSSDLIPEVKEDQFLLDRKAAEGMGILEKKSTLVKGVGEDIVPGMMLQDKQVLGKSAKGEAVEFDLKGAQAQVTAVEKVIINGVEAWKVHFEELNEMVTGGKMTTRAGGKGIVRVEDNLAEKFGLPEGTQAVMGAEGMAKRGDLRTMVEMNAGNIGKKVGVAGQEVADLIVDRMQQLGETLDTAVKEVASSFGLKDYTGAETVTKGPLAEAGGGQAAVSTGEVAFMRLAKEGQKGPGKTSDRFLDRAGIQAMKQRVEKASQAKAMEENMAKASAKNEELIQTLRSLALAAGDATEGLEEVRPEKFKALKPGIQDPEEFQGTILDPKFKDPMKLMLPTREGGEEAIRLPAQGQGLGRRDAFENELGQAGATEATKALDSLIQQAKQLRVATGQIDITEDAESYEEASRITSRALKNQIDAIYKLGVKTDEGKQALKEFVDNFMPLINSLEEPITLQFDKIKKDGTRETVDVTQTAGEHVKSKKTLEQKALAIQDILAERASKVSKIPEKSKFGREGFVKTQSVPKMGEIFNPKNSELLKATMDKLGISFEQNAEHVDALFDRLESLKEAFMSILALQVPGTGKTKDPGMRPLAQGRGGGTAKAPVLAATEFRTDITKPLEKAKERLEQLRDAGKNVDNALESISKIAALQVDVESLPRDAVMLSRKDYENLKNSIMKEQGIGEEEASQRLERGVSLRYPVTGGQSTQVVKILEDKKGVLPEGKVGVAGPAAGSPKDIQAVVKELLILRKSFSDIIKDNKGFGQAADSAREEIAMLDPVIEGLRQSFLSATQNLDFDGDKLAIFGALSEEASQNLRTFTESVMAGQVSFENLLSTILSGSAGFPGGGMGGVGEFSEMFGKVAKGRTGDLKSAVLRPDDAENTRFETTAHTAGKLSVGLLSDAFNKLQVAIIGGATETGDAFATGMERIMLFINKSLQAKHGGGDSAGPLELVQDISRGPQGLKDIFTGMDKMGDDIYGELGRFNKEYRERMQEMLIAQPKETLQSLAQEMGALGKEENLSPENFNSTIQKMVDSLDMKSQFANMFDMLRANMEKALLSEGLSGEEASATINSMLTKVNKRTGKTKGLDVDRLLRANDPEFMATRKARSKEIKGLPPMDKAREVLDVLGANMGESIEAVTEDFELPTDPKEPAKTIVSKLKSWLNSMQDSFKVVPNEKLPGPVVGGKRLGVRGRFSTTRNRKTNEIKEEISINKEKVFDPLIEALNELQRVASGEVPATRAAFENILKEINSFTSTLGHEGIHKAAKKFPEEIENLNRRIFDAGGDLRQYLPEFEKGFNKIGNVVSGKEKLKKVEEAKSVGQIADIMGVSPQHSSLKDKSLEAAKTTVRKEVRRSSGEELVAHVSDPERWQKMFGHLPEEVQGEIQAVFDSLSMKEGSISGPVKNWATSIKELVLETMSQMFTTDEVIPVLPSSKTSTVESLKGAVSGESVASVRQEATDRVDRLNSNEDFPGKEKLHRDRELLTTAERTLAFGKRTHGLSSFEKKEGRISSGPVNIPAKDLIGEAGTNMEKLLAEAQQGDAFADVSTASDFKDRFKKGAADVKGALGKLGTDQWSGKPFREYQKLLLEYQAAEQTALINKARGIEQQISELRGTAGEDTPEFRDLQERLSQTIQEMIKSHENSLTVGGKGRGQVTSLAVNPDQSISQPALELGVRAQSRNFDEVLGTFGGREGEQSFSDFAGLVGPMKNILDTVNEGKDATEDWKAIWTVLMEKPEAFHENLLRVQEILSKWARLKGLEDPFSAASEELKRLAKEANTANKAIEKTGEVPRTKEQIASLRARDPKFGAVAERAEGGTLGASLKAQMNAAKREAKEFQAQLQEAVDLGIELPRNFEPKRIQLVDPRNNQVLQTLEMTAKRTGKTVDVALTQAGKAANAFGGNMRNALRRVVQWGMATGIVYGLVRAFRNLISTVTGVEQKIANLKKVMDTSVTNFEQLQDGAAGFAKEFGVSIDEVLDGMVVFGQQGLKTEEIMERTRATMLAVNTTTLSATDATEALTAAHKVFGNEVVGSTGFVDAWGAVAAKHAITAEDLANAVKRSGAAAQVAGVGFNDFLGVVTSIGAVTRQSGKEIATSTKFMFRAMRRPTAQKNLGGLGIQSLDTGGDFRPAMDVLKELAGSWDSLTRAQQVNTAQALAGIRHYNSFVVLMENFDEALLASQDAANSQGFAVRKNREAMQTMHKQLSVLTESTKAFGLELGKAFLGPATFVVSVLGKIVSGISELPGPLLQAGAGFAALGLAAHKGLDIALESMEALLGYDLAGSMKDNFKNKGLFGTIRSIPSGLKSAGQGVLKGAEGTALAENAGKGAKAAASLGSGIGKVGTGIFSAAAGITQFIPGLSKMTAGLKAASAATKLLVGSTGIGLLLLGLGLLYNKYQEATRSASDFEKSQENIIGKSEDTASSLRAQKVTADRLGLAYNKIKAALDKLEDPENLKTALDEGTYKSAALAASDYKDKIIEMSSAIAQVDPGSVKGIDEMGNLVVGLDSSFKSLTKSALDAQNALTASLKADIIKAYAKELKDSEGIWNKISEVTSRVFGTITGDAIGDSLSGKKDLTGLKEINKEISEIIKKREEMAAKGQFTNEDQLNAKLKDRKEILDTLLDKAQNIKRVFESMPVFEDMETAMKSLTPDLMASLSTAAETGVFGQGVDAGTLATSLMAKQTSFGGILGVRESKSAATVAGSLFERGIAGKGGIGAINEGAESGDVAILSRELASELVSGLTAGMGEADASKIIDRAQIAFAEVDKVTGELNYRYWTGLGEQSELIGSEALKGVAESLENKTGDIKVHFMRWTQKQAEEAGAATEKVLSLQFAGATAGIRKPSGGMPDIGPARFKDLDADQRVLREIPLDIQRLADVQQELNQITSQYSEDILSDVEGATSRQGKSAKALKVLTQDVLQTTTRLQQEGFDLTVLAHYTKAQAELNMILEQAADAARDAAAAEKIRAKFGAETRGALAGKQAGVTFDFGKSLKELSSFDRARVEIPGFDKLVTKLSSVEKQREAKLETLIEIEKRKSRFEESVKDLEKAKGTLTAEQMSKFLENAKEGVGPGEMALLKALEANATLEKGLMEKQTSIQEKMLEALNALGEIAAADADYNKAIAESEKEQDPTKKRNIIQAATDERSKRINKATKERISQSETQDLMKALGSTVGAGNQMDVFRKILGISEVEGKFQSLATQAPQDAQPENLERITQLMNELREKKASPLFDPDRAIPQERPSQTAQFFGRPGETLDAFHFDVKQIEEELNSLMKETLSSSFGSEDLKKEITKIISSPEQQQSIALTGQEEALKKEQQNAEKIKRARLETSERFLKAQLQKEQELEQASRTLENTRGGRLALAASSLADSLNQIIDDARKAEMVAVTKIGSDLEGPGARVGQRGFRTEFENRRLDIEKEFGAGGRPVTLDQMRSKKEALKQVDFDEKEAKIKAKQDVEVKALQQQQQMAESVVGTLADQLMAGTFSEDPQMEATIRKQMETLKDQLSTSEQAEEVGGELFFKGIPALEDIQGFAKELKLKAQEKTQEGQRELFRTSITDPITQVGTETNRLLKNIQAELANLRSEENSETKTEGTPGPQSSGEIRARVDANGAASFGDSSQLYRSFNSRTPMLDPELLAGKGTVDLRKQFSPDGSAIGKRGNLPAVGLTNNNINEQIASRSLGDSTSTPGTVVQTEQGLSGAVAEPARRANEMGMGDANANLSEAIENMTNVVGALADQLSVLQGGLEIRSPALENAFSTSVGEVVNALGTTLSVSVDNDVNVQVINAEDIASASSDAAASSLGADITELGTRIESVEGLVNVAGPINTRINDLEVGLETEITERLEVDLELSNRMLDLENLTEQLDPEALNTLTTQTLDINSMLVDLTSRVDTNQVNIEINAVDINGLLSNFQDLVASFGDLDTRVVDSENLVSDAVTTVENLESNVQQLEETLDTVASLGESTQTLATEINQSLNTLRIEVEQQRQNLETDIRANTNVLGRTTTTLQEIQQRLNRLQGNINTAITKADAASSAAQRIR